MVTSATGASAKKASGTKASSKTQTTSTVTNPQPLPQQPRLKPLSQWARLGLDLSSTAFAKLQGKESSYDDSRTKYDLEPEKFESYRQEWIEKVNRMHAEQTFTINDSNSNPCHVIKEYTKLDIDDIVYERDVKWPGKNQIPTNLVTQDDYDEFTDHQIKSSTIGSWINESLTNEATKQLRADNSIFEVEDDTGCKHFDGPAYFWKLAEFVDPENEI